LKPFGSGFSLLPSLSLSLFVICFVLAKRTLHDWNTRSQARGQPNVFINNKVFVSFLLVGIAEASKLTELALV
jgi:hypothetical protein